MQKKGDGEKSKRYTQLMKLVDKYDGSSDIHEWLTRTKLVAQLHDMMDLSGILPLLLHGPAFQVYQNMDTVKRREADVVERALIKAFGLDAFDAYAKLVNRRCSKYESVDCYLLDLKRLALCANVSSEKLLKCAFVNRLEPNMASVIRATPKIDSMGVDQIVDVARAISAIHKDSLCAVVKSNNNVSVKCFTCNEKGHISRNCPRTGTGLRKCFICNATTHLANACDQRRRRGSEVDATVQTKNE